jgi:hypothetical protein
MTDTGKRQSMLGRDEWRMWLVENHASATAGT